MLLHGVTPQRSPHGCPGSTVGTTPAEEELRAGGRCRSGRTGRDSRRGRGNWFRRRARSKSTAPGVDGKCHGSHRHGGPRHRSWSGLKASMTESAELPVCDDDLDRYIEAIMMPLERCQMQHAKLGFVGGRRPAIGGISFRANGCCLRARHRDDGVRPDRLSSVPQRHSRGR